MQKSEPYNEGWVWEGRVFYCSADSTAILIQEGKEGFLYVQNKQNRVKRGIGRRKKQIKTLFKKQK
jgi:hypothetical protein